MKLRLKQGAVSLPEVLKDAKTNDVIGKIKVSDLLKSMPGVGEVRARQIMERIGIAETRRAAASAPSSTPRSSRSSPPCSH